MKKVNVASSKTQNDLQKKLAKAVIEAKEAEIKQAYIEASQDPVRNELLQEWSSADAAVWEW